MRYFFEENGINYRVTKESQEGGREVSMVWVG
jgi:hypothetical protein